MSCRPEFRRRRCYFDSSSALMWGTVTLAAVTLVTATPARAEGTAADIDTGYRSFAIHDGGTSFFAYSQQSAPVNAGPNASSDFYEHGVNGFVNPVPVDNNVLIVVRGVFSKDVYGPVVGASSKTKPTGGALDSLTSTTPSTTDTYFRSTSRVAPANPEYVAAVNGYKFGSAKATGAAAAAVFDPLTIAPGTYPYNPYVDASFQYSDVSQRGGVNLYALDSRLTDVASFAQRGQPLDETLWHLTIQTVGPTTSNSQFYIEFAVNPEARALGILNPSVSDSQILAAVTSALTYDAGDGSVDLTHFSPFPANTTFAVTPQDGDIEYGVAATANFVETPEPTSGLLLTLGAIGLFSRRHRSKR